MPNSVKNALTGLETTQKTFQIRQILNKNDMEKHLPIE